jgi:two-component system, NtrC family, response regulator AtoC
MWNASPQSAARGGMIGMWPAAGMSRATPQVGVSSSDCGNLRQVVRSWIGLEAKTMQSAHVLLVEPDSKVRRSLGEALAGSELRWTEATSVREAIKAFESEDFDVVLLALRLPDGDGLELLPRMVGLHPATPVIVITANSSVGSAVEAMKRGAFDYLPKPVSADQVLVTLRKAVETHGLRREVERITRENVQRYGVDAIIGQSAATRLLRSRVRRIAQSPATTVLIQGESGTGKDLVAKAIHYASERANQPFVPINCSAIPDALLESELFGHEAGAFTDAKSQKRGLLEVANRGTAFLDEVAELGLNLQAKLLRFLEEQTITRVGGIRHVPLDLRIIAATNVNLRDAVAAGRFRGDLYYRLQILPVIVPALRERTEDIPLLAHHFVDHFNKKFRKRFEEISAEAMEWLCAYSWPGNVRELKNALERVMLLEDGPRIEAAMLVLGDAKPAPAAARAVSEASRAADEELSLEQVAFKAFVRALERTKGNQSRAAKLLGVSRDRVRGWMRKYRVRLETRVLAAPDDDRNA